ncbi:PqiC family protein [Crenobacter sp. SG2303]|uniref:PqiC family protein n=2 Tax=Crenobacter oryzisoli TaxID=3056844 RepID=A0ABT7XUV1_9NEIS|nr:PqiC family protein [Crenobacter sp. SG2303]
MKRWNALPLLLIAGGLAGCASPEARYYTLAQGASASPAAARITQAAGQPIWIEVAPVRVPERLNRQNLLLVNDNGALKLLERDRWSAPLPDELRDALSQRLQDSLGAVDLYQQGLSGINPVYNITTQVLRLDAKLDKGASAEICWTVRRSPEDRVVAGCTQAELSAPGGVEGVVAAYRKVVIQTAADITMAIQTIRS